MDAACHGQESGLSASNLTTMAAGTPMIRSWAVLLGACVLVLTGCGRFASTDDAARAEDTGAHAEAPADPDRDAVEDAAASAPSSVADPASAPTTDAAVGGPEGDSPVPTAVSPGGSAPGPRNAAAATTDGFEVRVVAESGPEYPSRPRFRIEVTLTNRSDRTRYHSLGQGNFAAIADATGTAVWTSTACNPTLGVYEISGGAAPIEPGQDVSVIVEYPSADDGEECDLPDGSYVLFGQFPVCPDDQVRETSNPGTYSCPEESVVQHRSAGLPITFG